jgi:outer membrane protein assembly factor BamB
LHSHPGGTAIVAVGPGTVTGGGHANAIVALDPQTLTAKDWFTQPGVEFIAAPVLFHESGKDIVAVTTRDGRILLLDAASLGGANHATPLLASPSLTDGAAIFAAQSPAMWQERVTPPATEDGTRWLLVPVSGRLPASVGATANGAVSSGAILAVRIGYQGGTFSVQPAWMSQNVAAPLTPIVVNGVVFAASASGERTGSALRTQRQDRGDAVAERRDDHIPAVGKKPVGRVRPRVRRNAGRHGLRLRVCDGEALGQQVPEGRSPTRDKGQGTRDKAC